MASGRLARDGQSLRYEPIRALSREDALRALTAGGTEAVNAIYSVALHDQDDTFAEETCLNALDSGDERLRIAAIGAIGEMTVFANRKIDFERAESRLLELRSAHPEISGRIEDALDDFAFSKARPRKESEQV